MNASLTFAFKGHTVRTAGTPDAPLFVAADVCRALDIGNVTDAVARLDDDETTLVSIEGRPLPVNALTESGLYSLILGSRKPEARAFKKWVTSEVLPAIRRTGRYEVAPVPALPSHPEALRGWADALEREAGLKALIIEQAPAVALANRVVATGDDLTLRASAKLLNQDERGFCFALEKKLRFLYRLDGRLTPHAAYGERGQGLFRVRLREGRSGATFPQTIVTVKGLARIAKELGIAEFQAPLTLPSPCSSTRSVGNGCGGTTNIAAHGDGGSLVAR